MTENECKHNRSNTKVLCRITQGISLSQTPLLSDH